MAINESGESCPPTNVDGAPGPPTANAAGDAVIECRILGTIEFRELEPRAVEALLSQPKRLAVLAYLILAASPGGPTRDRVVAAFWPGSTRQRGRGSLRNTLHFLRRHLGADAIRGRGEQIACNEALLRCDALMFRQRVAEGREREALDLYRGDLLPGLEPPGEPEFVTWLERERERLRDAAANAAWALSAREEARGNWISATDYGRRATRLAGDDERAVRRLLRLLERSGDRVAALREYESFVARWEREHGLRPSPETRAVVDSIRAASGSGPVPGFAPGTVPPRREGGPRPGKIAVLPFSHADGAGPRETPAAGLAHEIIASLSRFSGVHVIAGTSINRYRTRDRENLPRIAAELGVDTVLDASVRATDDRLAIVARLVEAATGTPLWAEVYDRASTELLSLRTDLVEDILHVLDLDPSREERAHLARVPTAEPEAYRLYLEGRLLWNRRSRHDLEAALRRFEEALEIDPRFALALAGLSEAYLVLLPAAGVRVAESRTRAREAARAALEIDPRLGEAHATLAALRGVLDRDWTGAEEDFRRALQLSPGHATSHHWYGAYLSYIRRRFEDAARELELARQLDPLSPIIHNDIGQALMNRGRTRAAIRKFREALDLEPDFWRAHYELGVTLVLTGDPIRGAAHLEHAWRLGAYGASPEPHDAEPSRSGDWRGVLEQKLERLEASSLQRGTRGFEAALLSMLLGRHDDAVRWVSVAEREGSMALVMQYFRAFQELADRAEFAALLEEAGLGAALRQTGSDP